MIFHVDPASAKPVYQQLVDQIRFAVAGGRLVPGDRLPTIREVAVQVRVNRNTVARVYSELEREGLLRTRAGQGAFVADPGGSVLSDAERLRRVTAPLDEALAAAVLAGLDRAAAEALVRQRIDALWPAP